MNLNVHVTHAHATVFCSPAAFLFMCQFHAFMCCIICVNPFIKEALYVFKVNFRNSRGLQEFRKLFFLSFNSEGDIAAAFAQFKQQRRSDANSVFKAAIVLICLH